MSSRNTKMMEAQSLALRDFNPTVGLRERYVHTVKNHKEHRLGEELVTFKGCKSRASVRMQTFLNLVTSM